MNLGVAFRSATALGMTLAVLAGCVPSPPPPPPPPPPAPAPPPPPPPPPPVDNWQDVPLAPGTWVYRDDARGSVALFGERETDATFVVRCEMPARRIVFSRRGEVRGSGGVMQFQATHGRQSYEARDGGGELDYVVASTAASDPYLDTIAFSRGRITVAVTGQPLLAVPNWAEMTRVFEDCRG